MGKVSKLISSISANHAQILSRNFPAGKLSFCSTIHRVFFRLWIWIEKRKFLSEEPLFSSRFMSTFTKAIPFFDHSTMYSHLRTLGFRFRTKLKTLAHHLFIYVKIGQKGLTLRECQKSRLNSGLHTGSSIRGYI